MRRDAGIADFLAARILMVKDQLERRGIRDPRVLDAIREIPREVFVRPEDCGRAYDDEALPIEFGQTISQPYIVALTCQSLAIQPDDCVLEIGTGSGYQSAILSKLARRVVSIERVPELADSARSRLRDVGAANVDVVLSDGTLGLPAEGPFDAIAVAAAAPEMPSPLIHLLAAAGRIVIPVGRRDVQELLLCRRNPDGNLGRQKLCDCRFVPLIGRHGFSEDMPDAADNAPCN